MNSPFIIWVITEGIAGTENQCLGVAEALAARLSHQTPPPSRGGQGGDIVTKRVNLRLPYRLWSPFLKWGEGPRMLTRTSDKIVPPWPDVVIAGGRKAVGIARYIRRVSNGQTFVCLVQHPKVSFDDFDLVAMPRHDSRNVPSPCKGEGQGGGQNKNTPTRPAAQVDLPPQGGGKIILTHGAPNRITPALLDAARAKWRDTLAPLPGPRTAVLIGGTSKHHRMGAATMDRLIEHVRTLHATRGGSLMITVSRRTPEDLRERLCTAFHLPLEGGGARPETGRGGENIYLFTGTGDNPYHGFLAYADYIICTTDSTSMISDAATTGKPIEFFPLPGGSRRHDRFIAHCRDLGVGVPGATYTPWKDAERVAEVIEEMLKKRPD